MSLFKYLPKEKREIAQYPRVKGGKVEIVSEHEKMIHVKPKLTEAKVKKITKGKAKKLIMEQIQSVADDFAPEDDLTSEEEQKLFELYNNLEYAGLTELEFDEALDKYTKDIMEQLKDEMIGEIIEEIVEDPEYFGLKESQAREVVAKSKLVHSEAYKIWIKQDQVVKSLQEQYEDAETEAEQIDIQNEIQEARAKANELYSVFRFLIEEKPVEEILKEDPKWREDFYQVLSEADRYNFKTLEQMEKEQEAKVTKIDNPFFDQFFEKQRSVAEAPITFNLSETGDKVLVNFDNVGERGSYKVRGGYGSDPYDDFLSVIRDQYNGVWVNGSQFVVEADKVDGILRDLNQKNRQLTYAIVGENNTRVEWESKSNIPTTIIETIEGKSGKGSIIFEIKGNEIFFSSTDPDAFGNKQDMNSARNALSAAFTRVIGEGQNKKTYMAVTHHEDGKKSIPIGLLGEAYWLLKKNYGFDVAVSDERPRSPVTNPNLKGLDLYSFQKEAVLDSLIEGQGLVVSPTGTGKTVMAAGIISGFIQGAKKYEEKTGEKVDVDALFLVHRGTLRDQAKESFDKFLPAGTNIGVLQKDPKMWNPQYTDDPDVNVGMIQGLHKVIQKHEKGQILDEKEELMLKILRESEVIIQDEAHHIIAQSYDQVYDENKTVHKYGLTATPSRKTQDDILRIMRIGDRREPITYQQAQNIGVLMRPNIVTISIPENPAVADYQQEARAGNLFARDPITKKPIYVYDKKTGKKALKQVKSPYWASIIAQIHENEKRNDLIIDHAHRFHTAGKTSLIFVRTHDHARVLMDMLKKEYPETEPVLLKGVGGKVEGERYNKAIQQENMRKMDTGESRLAVATDSFVGEGFDLPNLDVILGAGYSQVYSPISVMQNAGRAMRVAVGKEQPVIFEYADDFGSFYKRIQKRKDAYDEYKAFDYTYESTPPDYHKVKKGDSLFDTDQEKIDWVKKYIKESEGTNAQKFQASEFYQHKRARGLAKQVAPEVFEETKLVPITQQLPIVERLHDLNKEQLYKVLAKKEISGRTHFKKIKVEEGGKEIMVNALEFDNWTFDDKDREIASRVSEKEDVRYILRKAKERAILENRKEKRITPSRALRLMDQERRAKRIEF